METIDRQNRAFLSKIQCGCLRRLVKETLTLNPVGFNPVQSALSRSTHMLHRLVEAQRGVEHCLHALVPRHGPCGGGETCGGLIPSISLLSAVCALYARHLYKQPPQARQRR